ALSPGRLSSGGTNKLELHRIGPYLKTDRRHFLQQAEYTLGLTYTGIWHFCSHQEMFTQRGGHGLWKFNIPTSQRVHALAYLEQFNVNAFSLFGSDDSLVSTLAIRELDLGVPDLSSME